MKYVYNRNRYKLITEASNDSDNVNPEFGETLIGGALHRLLGFVRSAKNQNTMNVYSKQLDRLLGSMLVDQLADDYMSKNNKFDSKRGDGKDEKKKRGEDKKIFIQNIQNNFATQIIIYAGDKYMNGDFEEAKEEILSIPKDALDRMPESAKTMAMTIKTYEAEVIEDNDENNTESEDDSNALNSPKEYTDFEEVEDEDGEENKDNALGLPQGKKDNALGLPQGKKDNTPGLPQGEGKEDEIKKKYFSITKNAEDNYEKLKKVYQGCGDNIESKEKLDNMFNNLKKFIQNINGDINKGDFEKVKTDIISIEPYFRGINKLLNNCGSDMKNKKGNISEQLSILEYGLELLIREYNERDGDGDDGDDGDDERDTNRGPKLTQREFNKVRKDIEKEAKKWDVTEDDLHKIEKVANEKKIDVTKITSRQGKELMSILNKAKNALLHTKPYDEIRKNQKRWYDKLDKGGRAINRKGYQTWVKKVTEIVSYYKGQVPDKVITVITDSLDKENISNDYVTLTKEFLGINKRGRKPSEHDPKEDYVKGYNIGDTIVYKRIKKDSNGNINRNKGILKKMDGDYLEIETDKNRSDGKNETTRIHLYQVTGWNPTSKNTNTERNNKKRHSEEKKEEKKK